MKSRTKTSGTNRLAAGYVLYIVQCTVQCIVGCSDFLTFKIRQITSEAQIQNMTP